MKFQFFTYFLNKTKQISLLPGDREVLLREVIGKQMEFEYRGTKYVYRVYKKTGNFIMAKLGKEGSVTRFMPKGNNFVAMEDEPDYPHCKIFFNCNSDTSGQRIAFERSSVFSSPEKILKILEDEINKALTGRGYAMSINPITIKENFWKIVDKNQGNIQKLTFFYNVPNLFKGKDSLSKNLKDAQETLGITSATMVFENKEGLHLSRDNKFLSESVEYTGKGGGTYSIKIAGKDGDKKDGSKKNGSKTFNSKGNVKTKDFPKIPSDTNTQKDIEEIFEDDGALIQKAVTKKTSNDNEEN